MGKVRWKGGAAPIAQVNTIAVGGTPAASQVYTVTIGFRAIAYTASGGDTNNDIATALQALLAASTFGEFAEIAWTVDGAVITGTAATAGMPFVSTSSATGTGTLVTATATASSGPNDVSTPANWDTGALPAAGDTVFVDSTNVDLLWNLQALAAVTVANLDIASTFQAGANGTGTIGLPETNASGTAPYLEYRQQYLQIGATNCSIGQGDSSGSGRIKIDFGAVQTSAVVYNTGSPADTDLEAVLLKGTHASNVFSVNGGSVGIAAFDQEAATVGTLNIAAGPGGAPRVRGGPGCTVTALNMTDGTVLLNAAGGVSANKTGGQLTILTGDVTALTERAGGTAYLGIGTITTLLVGNAGSMDFSQDLRGRTVTTATVYAGGALADPSRTVTWTNPLVLSQCGLEDVQLSFGKNITLAPVSL